MEFSVNKPEPGKYTVNFGDIYLATFQELNEADHFCSNIKKICENEKMKGKAEAIMMICSKIHSIGFSDPEFNKI